MDEKEDARRATINAYARRVVGSEIGQYPGVYSGTFDYQAVAESIPLPRNTDLTEHQVKWNHLYSAFAQAWAVS